MAFIRGFEVNSQSTHGIPLAMSTESAQSLELRAELLNRNYT